MTIDTKEVTESRKSKTNRQDNGQKKIKRDKRINYDLWNTTQKTKDGAIRTTHKKSCEMWIPSAGAGYLIKETTGKSLYMWSKVFLRKTWSCLKGIKKL